MPERRFLQARRASYKRTVNRFEPRKRFLIVCEGKMTEPNYFKKFPIPPDSVVKVEGLGANTDGLVKEAINLRGGQKYDQVWVVFDRDSFTPEHFNNAILLANAHGIHCAYSNEAFELWYYLHFHYLDTGITRDDYCERLSRADSLNHEYEKNSETIYEELLDRLPIAIQRAKKLLAQYNPQNPVSDKPSTTVHLLVEQLNHLFWDK
jgi:hypothetical protein